MVRILELSRAHRYRGFLRTVKSDSRRDQGIVAGLLIRLVDIVLTAGAVLIMSPVMLCAALMIWLEDRGSIFFVQNRVGRDLKPFAVYKFRTMVEDTNRSTGDVETSGNVSLQSQRQQFQTTQENDARITKIGKLLRPAHVDELPQLFNVLYGDMSLVGVRPDVAVQEADYTAEEWHERHLLRPGITGLAQIDTTISNMQERTKRDLEWVRNRSLSLYFKILLLTVAKVFKRNSL